MANSRRSRGWEMEKGGLSGGRSGGRRRRPECSISRCQGERERRAADGGRSTAEGRRQGRETPRRKAGGPTYDRRPPCTEAGSSPGTFHEKSLAGIRFPWRQRRLVLIGLDLV
ncbi:hypothetical protein BHM03_00015489 [Ensete ventricosum]|nr:hypothetical protein BHM03_00015489 [Ensete ventricosum]